MASSVITELRSASTCARSAARSVDTGRPGGKGHGPVVTGEGFKKRQEADPARPAVDACHAADEDVEAADHSGCDEFFDLI